MRVYGARRLDIGFRKVEAANFERRNQGAGLGRVEEQTKRGVKELVQSMEA